MLGHLAGHVVGRRAFCLAVFALLFVIPFGANQYFLFVANLMILFIILSLGLNLLIGFAGQLAFANAAMYGIGAYGTGLLMKHFALPYWFSAPAGTLIAMSVGTLLALPALRLSGIYLALTTLAFAQFTLWLMMHWTPVTFGAGGFVPPPIDFGSLPISGGQAIYFISWVVCLLLFFVAKHTMESPIGRAFVAIRDREIAAQSLGIDLLKYKALAFAMSGFFAGAAGALYAGVLGFVGPESFDLLQMVMHKAAVVLGGMGSIAGSLIGGVLIVVLQEGVKEIAFPIEIVFGGLLLLFMLFQPTGVVVLLKRWLPGWQEPLHYAPRRVRRAVVQPAPAAAQAGED